MAEPMQYGRCNYFFLYDGTKVRGEGDPTRDGICYFYPEETPIDKQELLCGQLAGVTHCITALSSSPVRILKLHHNKFAIRMKEDFLWALGCPLDVPTVSMLELLDKVRDLFCFYNGPVRHSYQVISKETLAARWAQYLSHLLSGSTELHHIFSCLRTIDSTQIDPLLLLKAALILQACQRCPLVLTGCILFRGRVVSTQMPADLTINVMVQESETYKDQRPNDLSTSGSAGSIPHSRAVTSTPVFLTTSELERLRYPPVDRETSRSHSTPNKASQTRRNRLSRTLSDTLSTDSDPSGTDNSPCEANKTPSNSQLLSVSDRPVFTPSPSQDSAPSPESSSFQTPLRSPQASFPKGTTLQLVEEDSMGKSHYFSFHSTGCDSSQVAPADSSWHQGQSPLPAQATGGPAVGTAMPPTPHRGPQPDSPTTNILLGEDSARPRQAEERGLPRGSSLSANPEENAVVPVTLYQHRVKGLVLALLVEAGFHSDTAAMEEVYHSSLASLNGLEAHLRNITSGAPGPQGPYIFAHFDCIQNTLTTNLSARPGGAQERSFVKATSLLHSHFCHTETLQEAIVRNAGVAVYGTRSMVQETYFLQQGATVRNSGIPNHQDSAFSLPGKARHRLLKHGVNLL